jgi:isopenicillin N synthase-like dioxygenase
VLAGKPLQGHNQWLVSLPKFKKMMSTHWDLMLNLGAIITEGLALSLGLEKNFFQSFTSKSHNSMRILYYPPYEQELEENAGDGIGAHIDYGFLTILYQDDIGGLEVKNAANEWIKAPHIPGTFIINIGHMMQRWTNDFYKATPHRVISSGNKSRYSFPFFFEPNFETVIAPLDRFCDTNNPPHYEPFHFGKYLVGKFTTSYAETMM